MVGPILKLYYGRRNRLGLAEPVEVRVMEAGSIKPQVLPSGAVGKFEWGDDSLPTLHLSHAILQDFAGEAIAKLYYKRFAHIFLVGLLAGEWHICGADIAGVLARLEMADKEPSGMVPDLPSATAGGIQWPAL